MSEKEKTSKESNRLGMLAIVFIVFFLLGAALGYLLNMRFDSRHSLCYAREVKRRASCSANLSAIGKALAMYEASHNDMLPLAPSSLVEEGHAQTKSFFCPSVPCADWEEKFDGESLTEEQRFALLDAESEYLLIFRNINSTRLPDDAIQVYELPYNHGQNGVNMCNVNGSVCWQQETDYRPRVQKSHGVLNELRKGGR